MNSLTATTTELQRIAAILRIKRNDMQAMIDFRILVSTMSAHQRSALLQTLNEMMQNGGAQ